MDSTSTPPGGTETVRIGTAMIAATLERPLMRVLETIAALLVAAEIAIMLIGVIARYVFRHPLIWTDEGAQAVFLWLGMIGATVALNRGEHMRMTALIVRARPLPRLALDVFGAAMGLVFLAVVIQPSIDYIAEVSRLEMPGLGVSKMWITLPLPIGFAIMLAVAAMRLFRQFPVWLATALLVLAGVAAWFAPMADPWLQWLGNLNLLLFFVGLVEFSIPVSVPIAIASAVAHVFSTWC